MPTCCIHGRARGCDPRLSSRRRSSGTARCGVASPRRNRRCSLRVILDCGTRTTHASSPPPVESASSCCLAASTTQALTFRRDGFAGTCAATPQLGGHRSRAAGSFFGHIPSKAVRQWSAQVGQPRAKVDFPEADATCSLPGGPTPVAFCRSTSWRDALDPDTPFKPGVGR